MKNSKSQNPASKQMPIYKIQIPSGSAICNLLFGAWGLFGFWSLVLGILIFPHTVWAGGLTPEKLEKYFSTALDKFNSGDGIGTIKELLKARKDLHELEQALKVQGGRIPRMLRQIVKDIDQDIKIVQSGKPHPIGWIQNTSQQANVVLAMYLCRQDSRYRCAPRQCLTSHGNYHAIHQPQDEQGCR